MIAVAPRIAWASVVTHDPKGNAIHHASIQRGLMALVLAVRGFVSIGLLGR